MVSDSEFLFNRSDFYALECRKYLYTIKHLCSIKYAKRLKMQIFAQNN